MRKIKFKEVPENYDKLASPNPDSRLRASIGLESSISEFFYLNVDNLKTYEKQARKHFDLTELNQLAETIREHGVRQPLSVIKTEEPGIYQVVSGERRLRASRIAGLEKVPCIILSNEEKIEEIAVIENIQRSDLHPVELAEAYSSLLRNFNHGDQSKLAQKLSVSNSHISETLSLSRLPDEIKDFLLEKNISQRSILRKLSASNNVEEMKNFLGMRGSVNKKNSARKVIFTSFIKDGDVSFQLHKSKLTKEQKVTLKERLIEFIKSLEV
jgi:ParB family chromosome partitioning protein